MGFYIPEDDILHSHCRENIKSYMFKYLLEPFMRNINESKFSITPRLLFFSVLLEITGNWTGLFTAVNSHVTPLTTTVFSRPFIYPPCIWTTKSPPGMFTVRPIKLDMSTRKVITVYTKAHNLTSPCTNLIQSPFKPLSIFAVHIHRNIVTKLPHWRPHCQRLDHSLLVCLTLSKLRGP
jgi:hypothetical protein